MLVVLSRWRMLGAVVALCAMALNGAQAHLAVAAGTTETFEICNLHGAQTIVLETGERYPSSSEDQTCCGECVSPVALAPDDPALTSLGHALVDWHAAPLESQTRRHSPIWPGAPPHGPPATL